MESTRWQPTQLRLKQPFPGDLVSKELAGNAGDQRSIPGSGRSPEEGSSNSLQYSAWRITWTEKPGGL